jgi:hypothetical protein
MRSHRRIVFAGLLIGAALARPGAGAAENPAVHRDGTRAVRAAAGTSTDSATVPASACSDSAYVTYSTKWTQQYRFYIKSSTFPSSVSSTAVAALKAASVNVTRGDNDCGLSDNISATAAYQGTTTSSANITTSGSCGSSDGRNVIDFGTLPSGYLALTCWWTSGSNTVESDMRLNKASYGWVTSTSGCSNKFSVEDVATHEFGHVFGMGHVSESSHGNLTMSPTMYACQNAETSLGLGDVRGLESKY